MLGIRDKSDSTGSVVAGFVIGGLVGTAIAMIFAPQSGSNVRDNFAWRPAGETDIRAKRHNNVTDEVVKTRTVQRIVLDEGTNASPSS